MIDLPVSPPYANPMSIPTANKLLETQYIEDKRLDAALPPKIWMSICSSMYMTNVLIWGSSPKTKMAGKQRRKM